MTMASQGAHPACLFLAVTLLVTATSTVMLSTAILTNHWEVITFDHDMVNAIAQKHNGTHSLQWLYEKQVGKVSLNLYS